MQLTKKSVWEFVYPIGTFVILLSLLVWNILLHTENYRLSKTITAYRENIIASSTSYQNIWSLYDNKKWDEVIDYSTKYLEKYKLTPDIIDPFVYLYSSYSYYQVYQNKFAIEKKTSLELLSKGLININKYLLLNKYSSFGYFIKGLLLLNQGDTYKTFTNSIQSFEAAEKYATKIDSLYNAKLHKGITYFQFALWLGKTNYNYRPTLEASLKIMDELINTDAKEYSVRAKEIKSDLLKYLK